MTNAPPKGEALATGRTANPTGSTLRDAQDKHVLAALARRWRVLRLGCPSGCPLDHHEPPCHLAEVA